MLLFAACSDPVSPPPTPGLTETQKALVSSSNTFGFKLFGEIVRSAPDTNIFISPLSVSMALGMTYNGAAGETRTAMARALELSGLTIEEANQAYRSVIDLLSGLDPQVAFQIANSIWYRQGFTVEPAFLDVNQTFFDAEVAGLDFNSADAVRTINNWVDQKTNGKISKVIDSIDPLTMMYLINAIYFKGDWTYRFAEDGTHEDSFIRTPGVEVPCSMMSQEETTLPYYENESFQAVDLPYGDGDYAMAVFLPHLGISADSVVNMLTTDNWAHWQESFAEIDGSLYLPRFTLSYELMLNDVLTALGMGLAFDPMSADFSGINKDMPLYISSVLHKTFVEVNETGTTAAAVTVVTVGTTSTGPGGFVMHVSRPFVFVIHDKHSGTLLFMGKIVAPVENE
jgi:serpin B